MKDFILKYKFNIAFYLCIVLSLYVNFLFFYIEIENPLILGGPALYTLLNCIIFSLPVLLVKKKYHVFIWIYLFLLDILLISNSVYYRSYKNVIPFFSYSQINYLKDLSGTVFYYLKAKDFVFILNTIVLYLLYRFAFFKRLNLISFKSRIISLLCLLIFSVTTFSTTIAVSTRRKGLTYSQKFNAFDFLQPFFTSYYGILTLWGFQIYQRLYIDSTPLTENEIRKIENYIKNNDSNRDHPNDNAEGKNLIILLVESLSSWTLKYESGNASPFLNKLKADSTVLFIPQVLPQVNHGHSSDAQLIMNTGLLPVASNTVANLYANQYYPAFFDGLRKKSPSYFSFVIMGNEAYYWNQQTMNMAYQIDTLISRENLIVDDEIGLGISDKSILRQTIDKLKVASLPFYAQVVTLTSHDGVNIEGFKSNLSFPREYSESTVNFIKATEYVDQAIEQFIFNLKENDLYDNSVIIIVGDHESVSYKDIRKCSPELLTSLETGSFAFIPLYIINSGRAFEQKENQVIGQIDIYPTLLDIMGVGENYWQGLGTSIFSEKPPTFAVDKNLNVIGDTTGYAQEEIQHKIDAWTISDLIIRKKYFEVIKDKN